MSSFLPISRPGLFSSLGVDVPSPYFGGSYGTFRKNQENHFFTQKRKIMRILEFNENGGIYDFSRFGPKIHWK